MILNLILFLCLLYQKSYGLFEECNHNIHLGGGEKLFINSPYYPGNYPTGTSCRYVVTAPEDYGLKFKCDINLYTPDGSTKCINEIFYFNREGSELISGSEYFCGNGLIERTSFLNQAVISYISTPQNKRTLLDTEVDAEEADYEEIQEIEVDDKNDIEPIKEIEIQRMTSSSTTTTTTEQPFQVEHEDDATTKITTTQIAASEVPKPLTLMSSNTLLEEMTPVTSTSLTVDHNVSNSFAYVIALLSNSKLNMNAPAIPELGLPQLFAGETASESTSGFTSNDFLPVSTWRNGSIAIHKISPKRSAKVIVGQDYTTSVAASPLRRSSVGGGSFSCLVEVTEPSCDCGWSTTTTKIAGTSGVAGINEYPSMAGVMSTKTQKIFCGATIIHRRYLLSAAHCFITSDTNRPEYLSAVVGEHDLSTVLESIYTRYYDIANIIVHDFFRTNAARMHNDIALLKTRQPIEWNRSVGPACLPFLPIRGFDGSRKPPYAGQSVETAGWGTTSFGGEQSTVLLKTTLDVISREKCQNLINYLPMGAFCTYTPGRDTCQYDSGGALYVRGERLYAVGIVSYGYACATNEPSVNTRISSHLKWIRSRTPEVKYCMK